MMSNLQLTIIFLKWLSHLAIHSNIRRRNEPLNGIILYFVNHPQEIKNIELDNESSTFDILPVPIIIDGYHRWMAARYLYELGSLHKIHCLYAGREDVLDYLKGKLDTMPQEEIA